MTFTPRCGAAGAARLLALVVVVLFAATPVRACDDTILRLMTSSDPNSHFSISLRVFSSALSDLGRLLNLGHLGDDTQNALNNVNAAWIALDNRYSHNPPTQAKNDAQWIPKMKGIADALGRIRAHIRANEAGTAHAMTLELFNRLGSLFDAVDVSPEKRAFLQLSSHLTELTRYRILRDFAAMQMTLASFGTTLHSFPPVGDRVVELRQREAGETAASLSAALLILASDTTAPPSRAMAVLATEALALETRLGAYSEAFRSEYLMKTWFSKPWLGSSTATAPTTATASAPAAATASDVPAPPPPTTATEPAIASAATPQ